jgi:YesN/AraC family two-component response regulator
MDRIRTILVDDVDDIRFLMRLALQASDRLEVIGEAADGREAVALAEETQPEVVVLDLAMPVMDGLQAIPELHRVAPHCRILVMSGFNAGEASERALSLCAEDYLEKGTNVTGLPASVIRLYESERKLALRKRLEDQRQGS